MRKDCKDCGEIRDGKSPTYCRKCHGKRSKKYMRTTCKDCDGVIDGKHTTYCKKCKSVRDKEYYSKKSEEAKSKRLSQMSDWFSQTDGEYRRKRSKQVAAYAKKRTKTDPLFNLIERTRWRLRYAYKQAGLKKDDYTINHIGTTAEKFLKHIESQFQEGMSFENRSEWELDHIVPISLAETEDDIKILSNYRNIQPLWTEDNRKKSNSIDYSHKMTYVILSELGV